MSLPFTSVVSYHTNPMTCGVAKFSAELAKRLGVPFVGVSDMVPGGSRHPLFSLKWSEVNWATDWDMFVAKVSPPYSVFWHDAGLESMTDRAEYVFYATEIACPPAPLPIDLRRSAVTLFSFGMAHKIQIDHYRKIRALIERTGHTFALRISVALHEGTTLQDAAVKFDNLADAIGPDRLQVLGCLSDHALAEELSRADAVCAFFPQGVRANNTSVHTAMQAGCPIITNLDEHSPEEFQHGITVFDLKQLGMWPGPHSLRAVGQAGSQMSHERFSWDRLLEQMEGACDRSRLART